MFLTDDKNIIVKLLIYFLFSFNIIQKILVFRCPMYKILIKLKINTIKSNKNLINIEN